MLLGMGLDRADFSRQIYGVSHEAGRVRQQQQKFDEVLAQARHGIEETGGDRTSGADPVQDQTPSSLNALRQVAAEFESIFIHLLLQGMRRTVPEGGLIEKSFAAETYENMYDEHLAQTMAQAGGMGLADMIVDQLRTAIPSDKTE